MSERFSRLNEDVLETFARGGNPNTLPATDSARAYWEWKTNQRPNDKKLPAASSRTNREPKLVIVQPFGYAVGELAKVRISKRSAEYAVGVNGLVPALNWVATNEVASVLGGFEPAKLIVRTGGSNTTTEKTSRITRRTYKTRFQSSDQGYVMPFGRPAGIAGTSINFKQVVDPIKALAPITALKSVSFRNEIIATQPEFATHTGEADAQNPNVT
jgi:hypothetical protein